MIPHAVSSQNYYKYKYMYICTLFLTTNGVYYSGVDCGNPPNIGNGDVSFNTTYSGSIAVYTCKSSFVLLGFEDDGLCTCQIDGNWEDTPTCGELQLC